MNKYYEQDGITIYHGDCREVLPQIEPVDLVVTSPPYDNLRRYGGYEWDAPTVVKGLHTAMRDGAVCVWIVADQTVNGSETGSSFRQAFEFMDRGFFLWDTMIWAKNAVTTPTESRYYAAFEYMFVFSKGKPKTMNFICDRINVTAGSHRESSRNMRKEKREYGGKQFITKDTGRRFNVWTVNNYSPVNGHPAVFPYQIPKDHIRTWAQPGDVVLDPFMGSGTTILAAKDQGLRAIGIEIEEKYCEMAAKRLAQKNIFSLMDEHSEEEKINFT